MSSVREIILKNVNDFIEIRKIAQKYNDDRITFDVARVYVQNKNVISLDDAIILCDKAKEFNLPISLMVETMYSFRRHPANLDWIHSYSILEEKCSNDFTRKIGYPDWYAISIANLSNRLSIPLDFAKKITDLKIKLFEKRHNVNHEVAILETTYNLNKQEAMLTLEAINYLQDNNIQIESNSIDYKIRKYLEVSPKFYRKTVNDINIVASSENKMNLLERTIRNAYASGDKEYLESLNKNSKERNLLITDLELCERSCFMPSSDIIYLDNTEDEDLSLKTGTFYHETSHFLDYNTGGFYSKQNQDVNDNLQVLNRHLFDSTLSKVIDRMRVSDKIKTKISDFLFKHNVHMRIIALKIKKTGYEQMAENYVHNEEMVNKWKEEIEVRYSEFSEEMRKNFFQQKTAREKSKYIGLLDSITDIYDAIDNGNFHDMYGLAGHGKRYYSGEGNDVIEFVAQIGRIINAGGDDVLVYEFGEDAARSFKEMYNKMVNRNNDTLELMVEPEQVEMLDPEQAELVEPVYSNDDNLNKNNNLDQQTSNEEKDFELKEMLSDDTIKTTETISMLANDSIESLVDDSPVSSNKIDLEKMLNDEDITKNNINKTI